MLVPSGAVVHDNQPVILLVELRDVTVLDAKLRNCLSGVVPSFLNAVVVSHSPETVGYEDLSSLK